LNYAEYVQHDATSLAALVRARQVSADELLDVAIARSAQVNPQLNAVVLSHHEEARQAIRDGLPQGAFTGVPFLIKDLFIELKGTVTTNGSAFLSHHVSPADSTIAARYREAGLVMFGKTHSPELGGGPTTETRLFGVTRNPWDLSVTPGGSSGGSAAAIAAGIVPAANASDAGGSIRIPASLTGLFGLKPTRGRVPLGPARFDGGGGIATLHAITRSVRDSAALLDAVSGPESGATYGGPARADCLGAVARAPGRLRIALNLASPSGGETAAECLAAAHAAARMCEVLGHEVVLADPKIDVEVFARARQILLASTMAGAVLGLQRTFGRQAVPDEFEPLTWKLLEQGQAIRGYEVLWAREAMFALHKQIAGFMASHDIVLSRCRP
jgi:amidase